MSQHTDPDGLQAWDAWLGPQKKSVSVSQASGCDPARGWARYGLPFDAGDGFAYNREGWNSPIPPDRAILQLSTAWACVRLLSLVMSTLPCMFYTQARNGSRKLDTSHPLYFLLHEQPNADMTSVDFWQIMFAWMMMRGAAYCEKDYLGDRIAALSPLWRPGLTWTYEQGERIYRYTDPLTGRQRLIPTRNIWRLAAFTLGGREDISPIAYGARMFAGSLAADEASARTFESGMMASGFVTMPQDVWLTKEQRDTFQKSLDEFRGSRNAGGVFTLEGGAKYQALSLKPEDAQMLETRSFNVEEICRWFGVPPVLIGHGDKTSNFGTGLEQQDLGFLKYSLRTWLKKTEASAKLNLLTAAEKTSCTIEFSVDALLRADSKTRAEVYEILTRAGIYDRDYCRELENLPPKGGNAAVLMIQSQNVPIDSLGIENEDPNPGPPASHGSSTAAADAGAVQATALNGAQVTALQEILIAAAQGELPIETAAAAIRASFPLLTVEEIAAMITPLKSFTPAKPEPVKDPINGPLAA